MARAQAFVFDAYDTLFEVHSVMVTLKDVTADAEAVSLQWRVKQLEYAWHTRFRATLIQLSVTKICGRLSRSGHGGSSALKAIAPWVIIRQCQLPTNPRRATMTSNSAEVIQHV
jgi:FMN phosphatase YigB (HAD superfamily)